MAARAQGTAAISFGLVSIPIKLYTTAQSTAAIRFNQLGPDGARVKQQYISSKSGEIVDRSEMVKGYEFAKGQFVTFSNDELKALEKQSSYTIDIKEFVPADQVNSVLLQKTYYLGPDKGGAKAYHLLAEAMRKVDRVAIAKYAARGKDYLVMLRPHENGLLMEQLFYADEIKPISDVPLEEVEVDEAELNLATQLIEQVTHETFDHENYEDGVRREILGLIEKKISGEEITVQAEDESETRIIDIMDALKASLDTAKKPAKRVGKRKKAASKTTARKATSKKPAASKTAGKRPAKRA